MFSYAETDPVIDEAKAKAQEGPLRTKLLKAQYQRLNQAKRALLVVISGLDGAGKGASVRLLNEWMDARHIRTMAFGDPGPDISAYPRFWRYWQELPPKGSVGIVFGSWYRELLTEAGKKQPDMRRIKTLAADIRDFESTLAQNGVQLLKLWYHMSAKAQKARVDELLSDPDTAWQVAPEDIKVRKKFSRLRDAGALAIAQTDRDHAPWHIVPAADRNLRALRTGELVLAALREPLRRRGAAASEPATSTDQAAETHASIRSVSAAPLSDDGRRPADGDKGQAGTSVMRLEDLDYGTRLVDEDYDELLEDWQGRLARGVRHRRFGKVPLVLVFEGQDAAGKGGTIRRITHAIDPRQFRAIPISAPTAEELARPYLWRFWRDLPRPGHVAIFDRSWYGRVLVERVEKLTPQTDWQRAYTEINQFEGQLRQSGALLLKFWLAITRDEQLERFQERETSPFKAFKLTPDDWRNRKKWDAYNVAANDMFMQTSTPDHPWHIIPANDKKYARIAVLQCIAQAVEQAGRR
jgi:polyphosphate kinase 2 (PPK2 family)